MWLPNNKTTFHLELIKNELHTEKYKQRLIYRVDKILQEKHFTALTSSRTNMEFTETKKQMSPPLH
jgi:hypothetical protein